MHKLISIVIVAAFLGGCAGGGEQQKDRDFFTSGSREADQRADQRMAQARQAKADQAPGEANRSLFERLGGEKGITAIVDDFVTRALADPRVNWERKGIKRGGVNLLKRGKSVEWQPSEQNVATLKLHLVQFLSLATGGPAKYEGREMKQVHEGMHITNAEFDASLGDLKATLDKLQIANDEQRELLSIIESTRPQVVAER